MVSWKLINPFNIRWLYNSSLPIRDDAGHAIGALFYSNESLGWPLGRFTSYGGLAGPSVVYWAISPLFAIPMKFAYWINALHSHIQFIGIQILFGFCLTTLALYWLSIRLGASKFAAVIVSLTNLFLPTLLWRWANESLSAQFIPIMALLLCLSPSTSNKQMTKWGVLGFLSVSINTYFAPFVLVFSLTEAIILNRKKIGTRLHRFKSFGFTTFIILIFQYAFGGFLLPTNVLGTGSSGLSIFSGNLFSLIDSRQYGLIGGSTPVFSPSWEGFNYLGFSALLCLFGYLILRRRYPVKSNNLEWAISFKFTFIAALLFYVYSLGPDIKIGSIYHHDFTHIIPSPLLNLLSIFRALGRFQWPLFYLLMALSAVGLTLISIRCGEYFKEFKYRKLIPLSCGLLFLGSSLLDTHYLDTALRSQARSAASEVPAFHASLSEVFHGEERLEVVPAYDGNADGTLPWRVLSEYALQANVKVTTWGFYARANAKLEGNIQASEYKKFITCNWYPKTLYLIQSNRFAQVHCKNSYTLVFRQGPWILIKN
jgi:hypothetical protein